MDSEEARYQMYPVALVKVSAGRRELQDITELMASITEVGLLNPITLNIDGTLIAGRHRLEAYRQLGRDSIPAVVVVLDEIDAAIAEIDENLVNNPPKGLERAEAMRSRKELYERKHPETKAGVAGGRASGKARKSDEGTNADSAFVPPPTTTFTADVAAKTGMSERTVQEDIHIAENITPEVKAMIRDTPLADQKTELMGLAHKSPQEQMEIVETYVEAVKERPFLAKPGWKPSQVLQVQEAIEALPVPERESATSLVDKKRLPPQTVVSLLGNLKTKPVPERQEIYRLDKSDDPRDRDLALTKTADTPPMPDPRIDLLSQAGILLREATKPYVRDPLTPRLEAVIGEVKAIRKLIEATSFRADPVANMEAAS